MGGFEAYLEASPGSPGWPDGLRRQGRRHSLISVPRERAARTRRLGQFFVEALFTPLRTEPEKLSHLFGQNLRFKNGHFDSIKGLSR